MIAYAPKGYFSDLACSYTIWYLQKQMRSDQNFGPTSFIVIMYESTTELDSLSDSIHFLEKESLVQIFG